MGALQARTRDQAETSVKIRSSESQVDRLTRIISETEKLGTKNVSGMTREQYLAHLLAK